MKRNYIFIGLVAVVAASFVWARAGDLSTTSGTVQSFEVSCGTSVTAIAPASGLTTYTDVRCGALGSTEIFIGGQAVTTASGYPICADTTTCPENALSFSVSRGYCIVAAGTETLNCIAIGN